MHTRSAGLAALVLAVVVWTLPAVVGEPPEQPVTTCDFCGSEQPATAWVCSGCGRLFRLAGLDPDNRFWGDAFYVLDLPVGTARPTIRAEVAESGLARETVTSALGDRYEFEWERPRPDISGRVTGPRGREADYRVTFQDVHDDSGLLRRRVVRGELWAKPRRHLHRELQYHYDDDRVGAIEMRSWVYSGANDRRKRPGEWLRHDVVEIAFECENGVLVRVLTERRAGVRDLRGKAGYASPQRFVETVRVDDGVVVGFGEPGTRDD